MGIYGIDLGTTYSRIAKLDANGNPEVIMNLEDASYALASAVYFESENNVLVGDEAKEYIEVDGEHVVQYVKWYVGKNDKMEWKIFDKTYSPLEIIAIILKRLKQIAEDQGEVVENIVITCPAYFGIREWNMIKKASELVELNVLDVINEPTAAVLNYCYESKVQTEETILVCDLGGKTFDVAIVDMQMIKNDKGIKRPKAVLIDSDGDNLLGGEDWDDRLYQYIMDAVLDDTGFSIEDVEAETKQDIRNKVEKTKIKLSKKESVKVKVGINGTITNVEVSSEDFAMITSDLVQKTLGYIGTILQRNPEHPISTVLLVGGSTYMPMIKKAMEKKFPGKKVHLYEPDCAIAKGAAIYGRYLEKGICKEKFEFIDECIDDGEKIFLKNELGRTQERIEEIEKEKDIIESRMRDMQENLFELERENAFLKKAAVYFASQIDFGEL